MNSDQLSRRLQTVAYFVNKYGKKPIRLADIGTDHAYLPVYLTKNHEIDYSIAADIVDGPYQSALNEVKVQALEDKIDVRLGDGLDVLNESDEINVVTICGMGGQLISQILKGPRHRLKPRHILVLQANTGGHGLRSWLNEHGYHILDEAFIVENGHPYEVIVAQDKGPKYHQELSKSDLLLGPINRQLKSPDYLNYWQSQLDKYQSILSEMRKSKRANYDKIRLLQTELKIIRKEVSMTDNHKITFQDLIRFLDNKYPPALAESWDKIGLHFGDPGAEVNKVMTALDIRPNSVQEAISKHVDTIIVHHPPIFNPIYRFDLSQPMIKAFSDLIKHDIKVFAIHTNLDIAWDGMNDWLGQALKLNSLASLVPESPDGQPGLGRIGYLDRPMTRQEVISHIKHSLKIKQLSIIEDEAKEAYQRIAIVAGAGASLLDQVMEAKADIFITGDISYHTGQEAQDKGFMTLDVGHYIEHIFVDKMAELLDLASHEFAWDIEIIPSESNTSPFEFD